MKIIDAVNTVDSRKIGNRYSMTEKIKWLSDIDGIIMRELINTHAGGENISFSEYNEQTDVNTVLLADDAYSDLYIYYLEAQIDRCNQEFTRYNNDMILFNNAYEEFANFYNRTHAPIKRNRAGY